MTEAETMPKSIHPYQQQISIKQAEKCTNRIFKASLFEFDFILFKIKQIKNIPTLHCKHAYSCREWAKAMRPQSNLLLFMLKVASTQKILIPTDKDTAEIQ